MTAVSASAEDYASMLDGAEEVSGVKREPSSGVLDTSRHRLAPGTRVGDHLVVRGVLGEGGTAVVYEALHTRLGASVALKVVDVSDEYMEGARARLLREAHVCASIEDQHIPRIYDVGELPDGTPFVVMERVSGRTLENVLLQGALPLDIAVQIAEDLLLAVEAVERANVVHRDIKPPNIILQTNSEGVLRVRLMDFGVSKNVASEREPTVKVDTQSHPSLTQQGAIVGTPHYMAPEQIVGPTVDSRADLYAVGVVTYEMMSGRTAFEGETTGDVVAAVLHTRPLPLSRLREVHPELEAWVERAMAPRRAERFRNAREMREALREAWDEHLSFVAAAGQRRWGRRARWIGAIGLVALGIGLPRPAGYDFSLLGRLFGSSPPAVEAAPSAGPQLGHTGTSTAAKLAAPAAARAATGAVAPASPRAEAPVMALTAKPVAAAPVGAEPVEPVEPPATRVQPAAVPAAAPSPVNAQAPRPATVQPGANARPAGTVPAQQAADALWRKRPLNAPSAVAPSFAPRPTPSASPTPRTMLMGDYVKELDRKIQTPLPVATPAREPTVPAMPTAPAAPRRAPTYDRLPENPYGD